MKNKKGNIVVIALIIVIVTITTSVITWIVATKKQVPVQQTTTATQKVVQKYNDNVFLAQSENNQGEVVFGGINVEKRLFERITENKRQLVLNMGGKETIISESEVTALEKDNHESSGDFRHFSMNFSPLGNYIIFTSQSGMAPGIDDIYSIKTGKVAGLNFCAARGGDIKFTPDEKYFYTESLNGICSAMDVFVYNSNDFSKKFRLTDKKSLTYENNEDISTVSYDKTGNFLRITLGINNMISREFKYFFENGKLVTTSNVGTPEIEIN